MKTADKPPQGPAFDLWKAEREQALSQYGVSEMTGKLVEAAWKDEWQRRIRGANAVHKSPSDDLFYTYPQLAEALGIEVQSLRVVINRYSIPTIPHPANGKYGLIAKPQLPPEIRQRISERQALLEEGPEELLRQRHVTIEQFAEIMGEKSGAVVNLIRRGVISTKPSLDSGSKKWIDLDTLPDSVVERIDAYQFSKKVGDDKWRQSVARVAEAEEIRR